MTDEVKVAALLLKIVKAVHAGRLPLTISKTKNDSFKVTRKKKKAA